VKVVKSFNILYMKSPIKFYCLTCIISFLLLYFIDALLSDLSYSQSEDSSYENVPKKSKPNSALIIGNSGSNVRNDTNTKINEVI